MFSSLKHGTQFNNKKVNNDTKKWFKEGFKNNIKEGLTSKTYNQLKNEYNDLLSQYSQLLSEIKQSDSDYAVTTNPNNIYLNKNIRFKNSDGTFVYAYVTNKGVVKKFADLTMFQQTAGLNGCPTQNYVDVNIAWTSAYDVPGTSIQMPTIGNTKGPKLTVGAPMKTRQSCGSEGSNVLVDIFNDTPVSRYIGCFDNQVPYELGNSFYNGNEPFLNYIQNNNFVLPTSSTVINQNYTASSAALLTNWTTTNTGSLTVIVNSTNTAPSSATNLVYPTPYPNPSSIICVSLNGVGNISQTISSLPVGTYTLSFNACGLTNANPINITINGTSIFTGTPPTYLTPSTSWSSYQYTYTSTVAASNVIINFVGTDTTNPSSKFTAIQNIRLTNGTSNTQAGYTYAQCQAAAQANNSTYFGFQNVNSSNSQGYCTFRNDSTSSFISGLNVSSGLTGVSLLASNTTNPAGLSASVTTSGVLTVTMPSGTSTVQVSTNTPLTTPASLGCYLILSDDGYMKIYSGATVPPATVSASNLLWTSSTPTKQLIANPAYSAAKGKGGVAYIGSGTTMNIGDFIGSPSGTIYLAMQNDGNLVLYTSSYSSTCTVNSDSNNMQGGLTSAALYKINTATDNLFTYLGKLFYINADDTLQTYPSTNSQLSTKYTTVTNYNNPGTSYNLSGDMSSYNTLDKCNTACNTNDLCYGYSYSTTGNLCNLKNSTISGDIGGPAVSGTNLYIRQQTYKTLPTGVSSTFGKIFSTQKQNYDASGNVLSSYGNTVSEDKRAKLIDLQNQLEDLLDQMNNYDNGDTSNYNYFNGGSGFNGYNNGMDISDYVNELKSINKQIYGTQKFTQSNLDNMVKDTDLVVLQDNYNYITWSILASATILILMNVSNK